MISPVDSCKDSFSTTALSLIRRLGYEGDNIGADHGLFHRYHKPHWSEPGSKKVRVPLESTDARLVPIGHQYQHSFCPPTHMTFLDLCK